MFDMVLNAPLRLRKILKSVEMNEHQNAGKNCSFRQCGPCRRYPDVGISHDIRSSSSHMHY